MNLEKLREEIDQLDEKLLDFLARRDTVVQQIGAIKADRQMDVLDREREERLYARIRQLSRQRNIDEEYSGKLFRLILQHSRELQRTIS